MIQCIITVIASGVIWFLLAKCCHQRKVIDQMVRHVDSLKDIIEMSGCNSIHYESMLRIDQSMQKMGVRK